MLENLAARVREDLKDNCNDNYNSFIVRLALITCAAALAHHGLLDNIDCVNLVEVDLSTVPAQHLVSLISNVTRLVYINYVRNPDKYVVKGANTERYKKSAVPFLQRQLNNDNSKRKKELKRLNSIGESKRKYCQ